MLTIESHNTHTNIPACMYCMCIDRFSIDRKLLFALMRPPLQYNKFKRTQLLLEVIVFFVVQQHSQPPPTIHYPQPRTLGDKQLIVTNSIIVRERERERERRDSFHKAITGLRFCHQRGCMHACLCCFKCTHTLTHIFMVKTGNYSLFFACV